MFIKLSILTPPSVMVVHAPRNGPPNNSGRDCQRHGYGRPNDDARPYEDPPPYPLERRELGILGEVVPFRELLPRAPEYVQCAEVVFRVLASAQPAELIPTISIF